MSDPLDERLERMLRERRFEPASPDLAQRIVVAARRRPRAERALSPVQWIGQLFAELRLPAPAYVIAGTLLLGFLVGLGAPLVVGDDSEPLYVQSFLYSDEDPS